MRKGSQVTAWTGAIAMTIAAASLAAAQDSQIPARPTFYKDVLPILQNNCQDCHRPAGMTLAGMVAPMSFISYEETRPWAKAIRQQVTTREMPPWDATDESHGFFKNERSLTESEREIVARWVDTGAARGNPAEAPTARKFRETEGWQIGKPDLIVALPEPYFVDDDVEDEQPRFTIVITEEMMPEPRWVKAIEYKPTSDIVHHITGNAVAPPIEGHEEERFAIGSISAGEDPHIYPEGFGNLLRAGSEITVSMHYHKEVGPGTGRWDQSQIGFVFHPDGTEIKHKVTWRVVGRGNRTGDLRIPPRTDDWPIETTHVYEEPTILLSLHPHMHYRGKTMVFTAIYPDGTKEELLNVDRYSYAWQINYIYDQPKYLPAGTQLHVRSTYNNSESVLAVSSKLNIDREVTYGSASTDEMFSPFVSWSSIGEADAKEWAAGKKVIWTDDLTTSRIGGKRDGSNK